MKCYPVYKDSGIEWIGQVPAHWMSKRLRYLVRLVNEVGIYKDGNPPINLESIESWTGGLNAGEKIDQEQLEEEMKQFKTGDVLFNKLRPYLAKVYRADSDGVCGSELLVLRPRPESMRPGFLFYRLLSKEFISIVDGSTYGTKMPRASWDFIGNLRVVYPVTLEQDGIVDQLDHKMAQIDDLIAKKERMIELLKEERTAIINQAVTKGLDSKAEMKDSGIEWLGKVPKHWEVKKLKYLVQEKLEYGANEVAELDYQYLPRYIRITDFDDDGNLREDTFKSLSEDKAREYLLNEGDILFARSGATVGKTFQFKNYAGKACFAGYLIKACPNEEILLSDFLYYYTRSNAYENWKNSIFNQATIQNIGADKYSVLPLPLPLVAEQKGIVDFIIVKSKRIDGIISMGQQSLALLKEYRTALISEVVTGKIDVRNQ